jgi:hypothetical protein
VRYAEDVHRPIPGAPPLLGRSLESLAFLSRDLALEPDQDHDQADEQECQEQKPEHAGDSISATVATAWDEKRWSAWEGGSR